jgi:hypothetical protein
MHVIGPVFPVEQCKVPHCAARALAGLWRGGCSLLCCSSVHQLPDEPSLGCCTSPILWLPPPPAYPSFQWATGRPQPQISSTKMMQKIANMDLKDTIKTLQHPRKHQVPRYWIPIVSLQNQEFQEVRAARSLGTCDICGNRFCTARTASC